MAVLKRRRARQAASGSVTVRLVLALAVLLEAGAAPRVAWRCLAESGDPLAERIIGQWSRGAAEAIADASDGEWRMRALAATWRVADTVGAPLAPALRAIAEVLADMGECESEVQVALAEPKSAVRLIGLLPLMGLAMGAAMGFGTLSVLVTHPIGIACGLLGIALMVCAQRWTRLLVQRAQPPQRIPGLRAELLAIALSSGASLARAEALVDEALEIDLDHAPEAEDSADSVLELSRRAGVPAVELLRSGARFDRQEYREHARARAAELGAKLLLPMGACTLPAFLLLGVAPMVLSVLGATL